MTALAGAPPAYGLWAIGGTIALLGVFFLARGRIRIEKGWAGFTIARFSGVQRFAHWLLAVSFLMLALTGLNMQLGSTLLVPLLGYQGFAEVLQISRMLHSAAVLAFMAGLLLGFLLWVRHSLPHWRDVVWLLKGGGMIVRGAYPPAWKFNAGQKVLFWLTMVGGVLLAVSGIVLLVPSLSGGIFASVLALLNWLGFDLPAVLTPIQEMQYAALWHGAVALMLTCVVIAHIFVRTVGIQGAVSAMASGQVDANWAKQHHSLWAEQELEKKMEGAAPETGRAQAAPAE